jgi:hypothetical protein
MQREVGLVLHNQTNQYVAFHTMDLFLDNNNRARVAPQDLGAFGLDGNPDFSQETLGAGWTCQLDADTGDRGPGGSYSLLSCVNVSGEPFTIAPAEELLLATVTYEVTGSDFSELAFLLADGFIVGPTEILLDCYDVGVCGSAELYLSGPPALQAAVDCDVSSPGIQDACTVPAGAQSVDVDVVFVNLGSDTDFAAAQFDLIVRDRSILVPIAAAPDPFDGNPDFQLDPAGWNCSLLPPIADSDANGPGTATSSHVCFREDGLGSAFPTGASLAVWRVHYAVPLGASGDVTLELTNMVAGDSFGRMLGDCGYWATLLADCRGATVTIAEAASPTPTPTATTPASGARTDGALPVTPTQLPRRRR